jgi:hypothetical protein
MGVVDSHTVGVDKLYVACFKIEAIEFQLLDEQYRSSSAKEGLRSSSAVGPTSNNGSSLLQAGTRKNFHPSRKDTRVCSVCIQ